MIQPKWGIIPWTIPNMLTAIRLGLVPLFLGAWYLPSPWGAWSSAAIFGLAALTDWLDGYLARRLSQCSPFGAFFDPVADKLMVVVALMVLVGSHNHAALTVSAAIIACREILVSALREWMAEIGQQGKMQVRVLGKYKTALQMAAIFALLIPVAQVQQIGYGCLFLAVYLTLWSMCQYLQIAYRHFGGGPG